MKLALNRVVAVFVIDYPPSSEGGSVEAAFAASVSSSYLNYPPSSEGGSVEAHLIALYADRSAVLSPLLGGGLR